MSSVIYTEIHYNILGIINHYDARPRARDRNPQWFRAARCFCFLRGITFLSCNRDAILSSGRRKSRRGAAGSLALSLLLSCDRKCNNVYVRKRARASFAAAHSYVPFIALWKVE